MGNSPCPAESRYVSVRGTGRCEREPAAAGWSDLWSYCPGSPTRQHIFGQLYSKMRIFT